MLKYGALCIVGLLMASTAGAQPANKQDSKNPVVSEKVVSEKDYYFASSNSKNRYFFNRASLHDRTDIGPNIKGLQSLWIPLTAPATHPTLSYIELEMLVDCQTEGKVGLLKATGYDANNTVIQKEDVPVKNFEWTNSPDQTSFNVNWQAACKNIVWPAPARFEGQSSGQVAQKAHQNNVLWNAPSK